MWNYWWVVCEEVQSRWLMCFSILYYSESICVADKLFACEPNLFWYSGSFSISIFNKDDFARSQQKFVLQDILACFHSGKRYTLQTRLTMSYIVFLSLVHCAEQSRGTSSLCNNAKLSPICLRLITSQVSRKTHR